MRNKTYLLLVVLTCVVLMSISIPDKGDSSASSVGINYSGQWWLSISRQQRLGFVEGLSTCHYYLVEGKGFNESYSFYVAKVTKYLQTHSESLSRPVESTLLTVDKLYARRTRRPSSRGEETPEELAAKWGAHNDCEETRGTGLIHRGYVQGFLECYSKHTDHEYGTFSKSPEWYVKAIADWCGTGPDPDELNISRQHEKIPEVLFRFHDENDAEKNNR